MVSIITSHRVDVIMTAMAHDVSRDCAFGREETLPRQLNVEGSIPMQS